jgi:cellulose synthase operon protein YhjU
MEYKGVDHDVLPEQMPASALPEPALPPIRLGLWNFYFLAKILLFWREIIGFHPLENLAFAAFLLAPVASPRVRLARTVLAIPMAVSLLYYDSWLPPIDRLFSQANLLANFSLAYLLELSGRIVNWQIVAMLAIGWAVYGILARYLRVGVVTMAILAGMMLPLSWHAQENPSVAGEEPGAASAGRTGAAPAGNPASAATDNASLDAYVREFHDKERQRSVRFNKPAGDAAPFDVIFIHICSLSWDDLQATGLDKHALWSNLDFVFQRFNSAASYSGPAAIRINRATCGQASHTALYSQVEESCYLLPSLRRAGFESTLAMNHDGHFDDFLSLVRRQGLDAPLLPVNGVGIPQRSFDNSPIYDDLGVLSRWLDTRQKSDASRVAMFYNTISLHDGNRVVSGPQAGANSQATYKYRVEKLLTDLNSFFDRLEKSGRRAVVVVVPEHGAALRGDKLQFAGLREVPTPAITTVPVGIKVIGQDAKRQGSAAQIGEPASYLAISQIVANMLEKSPFGAEGFAPADYLANLQATPYVAENDGAVMVERSGKFFLKQGKDEWREYKAR